MISAGWNGSQHIEIKPCDDKAPRRARIRSVGMTNGDVESPANITVCTWTPGQAQRVTVDHLPTLLAHDRSNTHTSRLNEAPRKLRNHLCICFICKRPSPLDNPIAAAQLSTCRKGARGKPGRTKTPKSDRNKRIQKKMLSSSHSKVPPPSFLSLLPSRSFRQYRPMPSMPCHTIPCHTKPFSQGRRGDAPVPERRKAKQPPSLLARSMPFQGRTPPCLLPILPSLLHQTPSIHSSMLNPPAQNAM